MKTVMQHKLILILSGVVVLGGAWYAMSGTTTPAPSLITSAVASGPEAGLVETLLALRAVKLDGTIFTEPSFLQLQDYSTQIVPEPVGRANPFAPLPNSAAPSASSTKGAAIFTPVKGAGR